MSLDAERAFDRVEWEFTFEMMMDRIGLGTGLISWVKLLYSSPVASVQTNNVLPRYKARVPTVPFTVCYRIEPFAIWQKSEEKFEGILRQGTVNKLSLYATTCFCMYPNLLPHSLSFKKF